MKFEYFEVRPCIEHKGNGDASNVTSFTSEDDFQAALEAVDKTGNHYDSFWTLYGRCNEPDPKGNPQFLACAIGEFPTKEDAHKG